MPDNTNAAQLTDAIGPNSWMVDEMYEQYLEDPSSVSDAWQDFFADYKRDIDAPAEPVTSVAESPAQPTPAPAVSAESKSSAGADSGREAKRASRPDVTDDPGEAIRGVGARIVENMEKSLDVPTATSFRQVPAKLLEVNRRVINGYLGRTRGGKVSFTHLIGYAVVRAIADTMPVMNNTYVKGSDGKPRVVRNEHVGLGIAVDLEKPDGSRTLMVPVIKEADTLDFKGPMPKLPYAANEFDAVGMVAGGTGITPMLQVLEKALADPADATTFALLFGNVTPDDILLKGRLDALAAAHPGRFAVEYYVDAPPSWWRGGRGYVDKKAIARFLPAATQKTKILVCGPPGLVKMVAGEKVSFKDQGPVGGHLADLGFSRDQVYKF